jgi:putative transposase
VVQQCVVHLIRSSLRYASRRDWAEVTADLKPVYTAVNEADARERLTEFAAKWPKYGSIPAVWERAWSEFVPFLAFPDHIREVVYTTNAIVIWSRPKGVLHVVQEAVSPGGLRDGCGYLPPSMTQIFRRNSAGPTCAPVRLAA